MHSIRGVSDSISELSDEELWLPYHSEHALPSDETSPLVTIGIVDDWSFHDLRHTKPTNVKFDNNYSLVTTKAIAKGDPLLANYRVGPGSCGPSRFLRRL